MANAHEKEVKKSTEEKLQGIWKFLTENGSAIGEIFKVLNGNTSDLPEWVISVIDTVYSSIEYLKSKDAKYPFTKIIEILSRIFSESGLAISLIGIGVVVTRCVYIMVDYFLKIVFNLIDIKESIKPKLTEDDAFVHEQAGLAARFDGTETFINEVDVQEHIDEHTLQSLISHVDIHIAVEQLGKLKSRIKNLMMKGGHDDLQKCLHFLILFVRTTTLRHSLLFRLWTCLKLKNYGHATITALKNIIAKERLDNRAFLGFFSHPSLQNAAVLTVFDPSNENLLELATFIKELGIPLQVLKKELHDQTFLIKPVNKPNIFLGRPFLSFSSVRSMKESTDIKNVRVRFKFTAVDGGFNLFYIQSPDLGEYMYMEENTYCKYKKMSAVQENAIWRVICVTETGEKDKKSSCFMFCTKKWPEKITFMDDSYYECAKGRQDFSTIGQKYLFTLTPPGYLPVEIQESSFECLTEVPQTVREKETLTTPNQTNHNMAHETICIPVLQSINAFLNKHGMHVEREIEQIEKCLSNNKDNDLQVALEKIAECLADLDQDELNDRVMQGVLEIISINFQLFQESFPYASILRKLLRVCGLIVSCVWHVDGIEKFVCSNIEPRFSYKATVAKDVRELIRFAKFLRGIECADNILERDIRDMKNCGKFCEELPCLTNLKEHGKSEHLIMFTSAKVSILQLSVLWQMYAVAKVPGHSERTANYLREIILSQKNDDIHFYDCNVFPEATHEMALVKRYLTCLGIGVQYSNSTDIIKLSPKGRKLGLMRFLVVPLLEELLRKHITGFVQNKSQSLMDPGIQVR